MTPDMLLKLRKSLIKHEGYRKTAYIDTAGKITIGIGDNISDRPVEDEWINARCDKLTRELYNQFSEDYKWFNNLNEDRQIVLINMAYNMGYKKIKEFHQMIDDLSRNEFIQASMEMMKSRWAKQVPGRAKELFEAMLYGKYNP